MAVFTVPELPKPTHWIPTATLHFRSHYVDRLRLFLHFTLHAAKALNVPCTYPASLPTKRTLVTVLKSPFVHKSAQENFTESVHKRSITVYDTDPLVLSRLLRYLEENMLAGVAIKAVKWERIELGEGAKIMQDAVEGRRLKGHAVPEDVKQQADKIVKDIEAKLAKTAASSSEPPTKP